MRSVAVLAGLTVLNLLVLPPLLRWIRRSAEWIGDAGRRREVVGRFALDELAEALMCWRVPDHTNELGGLIAAVGVTALLLGLEAMTILHEFPMLRGSPGAP